MFFGTRIHKTSAKSLLEPPTKGNCSLHPYLPRTWSGNLLQATQIHSGSGGTSARTRACWGADSCSAPHLHTAPYLHCTSPFSFPGLLCLFVLLVICRRYSNQARKGEGNPSPKCTEHLPKVDDKSFLVLVMVRVDFVPCFSFFDC